MAMLPFCGYNMGDYWQHWLDMGKKLKNPPLIFNVNWFRLNENGKFMWPGFGDNFRVLEWILRRCEGKVDARETEIGYLPYPDDINLEGLDYTIEGDKKMDREVLSEILKVEREYWLEDVASIKQLYAKFGDRLPRELAKELETLEANLTK
jgi:phosphoenolpyruvate carboxykinase (GTP)